MGLLADALDAVSAGLHSTRSKAEVGKVRLSRPRTRCLPATRQETHQCARPQHPYLSGLWEPIDREVSGVEVAVTSGAIPAELRGLCVQHN